MSDGDMAVFPAMHELECADCSAIIRNYTEHRALADMHRHSLHAGCDTGHDGQITEVVLDE